MTDAGITEVMAHAAHTVFAREDRWDLLTPGGQPRVAEIVKNTFRAEARAALSALRAAGVTVEWRA
jgi:hypothetical protein